MATAWLHKGQYSGKLSRLKTADGLLAGITAYSPEHCNPHFHCHENPHLILVLNGGNVYNTRRQSREKTAGDMLFYHSGEVHQTLPGTTFSRCMNIELEHHFLQRYHISEKMVQRVTDLGPDGKFLLLKMYKELQAEDAISQTALPSLWLGMLGTLQKEPAKYPPWLTQLLNLLNDEWDSVPGLETLSARLGVHPVTISKYFTRFVGCTLGEYLRKTKIEKSLPLIRSGNYSLTEVATACGFADQSHFIRNFKAHTGWLPKAFEKC